jgi:N-acetylmuramoyl-L-alanine amidase
MNLRYRLLIPLVALATVTGTAPAQNGKPEIRVFYPREGQLIAPVDSQFVVGQASGATDLKVNGVKTELFDSGAFLGWVPVTPGAFTFQIEARNEAGRSTFERSVDIIAPVAETSQDSLRIEADYRQPALDLWLWPGDLLEVYCRTSPRAEVFFSIPGVAENIPMIELPAQRQAIFSGNAWRNRYVPDSLSLHGIYFGSYRVASGERADSARIVFHARNRIALYDRKDDYKLYATDSVRYSANETFADLFTTDSSAGRVTILDDRFPYLGKIKDSVVVTRVGPGLGYFWPFTPKGTQLEITGRTGDWVRLRAAPNYDIWAHDTSVVMLPPGFPITRGTVNKTEIAGQSDRTEVRLFLTEQLPYRIAETLDPLTLTVTVYGATSDIDWIRYDFSDAMVEYADWKQPQPGVLEYTLHLNCHQLWGYDSYYEGTTLVVAIRKPPATGRGLRGWHIVVDPGHSADDGAVGPTGLKEKDANLWISRELREALERRGAEVTLTRTGSQDLPLYDRPIIAKHAGADLFISVHNNALPDGVNPWANHGVSTYYYHPFQKRLAEEVQASLLSSLDMPDFGLYRANFAVIRPTQYPAILVECAFMMLPDHEAALKTKEFQEQVAQAITEGIRHFVEETLPDEEYLDARKEMRRR